DRATPALCSLSLHDALPICEFLRAEISRVKFGRQSRGVEPPGKHGAVRCDHGNLQLSGAFPEKQIAHPGTWRRKQAARRRIRRRSEEHTSELQSRENLVCRL